MKDFNTNLITKLANGESIQDFFKDALENALNTLLETERTIFLDYEKWEVKGYNTGNSRNGYYSRTIKSEYGELQVKVPRDRMGLLKLQTIDSFQNQQNTLEDTIILLYKKGITTREISDIIEKMYGQHYSPATISTLSNSLAESIEEFRNRKIKSDFVALFCDATYINVRRESVSKEAVHIIIGVTSNGHKEILDFQLFPTESAVHYREMLQDLKCRGLENVLLFVSDDLNGLPDALKIEFPNSIHQTCWTHLLRNVGSKVRPKHRGEVLEDMKAIYQSENIQQAGLRLSEFVSKWGTIYPKLATTISGKPNLFSYMQFPREIWGSLYTNNISENFNKQLKRRIKTKEQFTNESALEKAVFCYVSEYNSKFSSRIHRGFGPIQFELEKLLEQKRPVYESNITLTESQATS